MRNHNHGSLIFFKMIFQPGHRFGVQMVGRLVQKQHVRFLQQQTAQSHAAFFASGKFGNVGIGRRTTQSVHCNLNGSFKIPTVTGIDFFRQSGLLFYQGIHFVIAHRLGKLGRNFLKTFQQVTGFAQSVHNVFHNVFVWIQFRLLLQITDLNAVGRPGLAIKLLVHTGHNFQQCRFTGAVHAQHADFGARQKRQRNSLEQFPAARKNLG